MTQLGGEWIPAPGQGDRNHVLEFCEHGSTEDPVRLTLSSWGTSRMCMWPGHNGGVAQQRTQKQALRFGVTGGVHSGLSVRGNQWRWALRDAHGGWRFDGHNSAAASRRGSPLAQASTGGPRSLHRHPSAGLRAPQPLVLRDVPTATGTTWSAVLAFLVSCWFGNQERQQCHTLDSHTQDGTTGRKGQLRVCPSEGTETLSSDNAEHPLSE